MLAQLDAESVVLEVVKGTSLTGPATAATETKDKGDALVLTAAAQVNCAPQYGLENWRLWPSSENWAAAILRKACAEDVHRRKEGSPKNICAELRKAEMSRMKPGFIVTTH